MSAAPGPRAASAFVEEIETSVASVLSGKRQLLRTDVDPEAWVESTADLAELMRRLVVTASRSAPAESELFLSAARPATRLTRVGEIEWVLRWQVDPGTDPVPGSVVVPLRRGPGGAPGLLESRAWASLSDDLLAAGWGVDAAILREGDSGGGAELRVALRFVGS